VSKSDILMQRAAQQRRLNDAVYLADEREMGGQLSKTLRWLRVASCRGVESGSDILVLSADSSLAA